jgi:protein-S-isoprenylcysteine O-methyltransferase Ste14
VLIFLGVRSFNQQGGVDPQRIAPGLVGIEKTTQLVTTGIYRYIRHPFYASLLFLSWGIFFKHITLPSLSLSLLATIFLFICAWIEEGENEAYFGQAYRQYMKQTKMFIPFVV